MLDELRKNGHLVTMNLQKFAEEEDKDKDESDGDGEEEEKDTSTGETKVDEKKDEGKTFTQAQLNKMMAREKQQGRVAALKEFGIDPKDPKALEKLKSAIDSMKTDEQKSSEAQAEKDKAYAEAERRALVAEAKVTALQEGIQPKYVDDAITLAMAKITDDGSQDELKTVIGELKTRHPNWFEESEEGTSSKKGTGSSIKNLDKGKKKEEDTGIGARLAAQRKPKTSQQSYWGSKTTK